MLVLYYSFRDRTWLLYFMPSIAIRILISSTLDQLSYWDLLVQLSCSSKDFRLASIEHFELTSFLLLVWHHSYTDYKTVNEASIKLNIRLVNADSLDVIIIGGVSCVY